MTQIFSKILLIVVKVNIRYNYNSIRKHKVYLPMKVRLAPMIKALVGFGFTLMVFYILYIIYRIWFYGG